MEREVIERLLLGDDRKSGKWVTIKTHAEPDYIGARIKIIDIQWKPLMINGATNTGYTIAVPRFEDLYVPKYITPKLIAEIKGDVTIKRHEWGKLSGMDFVPDNERMNWFRNKYGDLLTEYEWESLNNASGVLVMDFDKLVELLINKLQQKIEEQETRSKGGGKNE